jgi:type IV pilus secretin PilQ/predicted competence protein
MVAAKYGSLKTIAAVVASTVVLGFVLACVSTTPVGDLASTVTLSEVQVASGSESTAVTLVGLADPMYITEYDAELRTVVIELASVATDGTMDRVDVYDGIIEHVTATSYLEDGGESITRVEIAMGIEVGYTASVSENGLVIEVGKAVEEMAAEEAAEQGDPWAVASGMDTASVEVVSDDSFEIAAPRPPVATTLSGVEVQTLEGGALIHLKANGSIWALESSVLENPDRLVVDLLGMTTASVIQPLSVEHAMVSGIRVGIHADRTRVVVDGGVESLGFSEHSIKPSADGLYVAVGSGIAIESAINEGIENAEMAWAQQAKAERDALAATATVDETTEFEGEPETDFAAEGTEDDARAAAAATDTEAEATDDWSTEAVFADEVATATDTDVAEVTSVVEDIEVAAALTEVHGVHYTAMDNMDRIAVLSEAPVDYTVHSPDPGTLVVSLFGASISPQVAGWIRGISGGPVSLVTIFEQPDVDRSEVRLVVTRAPDQEPLISRRGGLLFVDFEHLGVAAAAPPAFPEESSTGLSLADAAADMGDPTNDGAPVMMDEAGEELVFQTLTEEAMPEMGKEASLDGEAASDEFADVAGPLDDFDTIDGSELGLDDSPASLEPPASVEVLVEGGLTDGKEYSGRRISLDFNGVPISDVLRLIAEVSDLNLIAGDEVKGSVTIRLVDTPWDQALDVVLLTKGLGFVRVGNILRVAPSDVLAAEEELRLQERRNREKLEDLMVKLLPVNYAAVKDMSGLVKRLLSSRGTVNIDERTNTLILKDIASVLDEAVALVKAVDTETPQVMIEAKIVEANLNFSRELGSSWSLTSQPLVDPFTGAVARDDLGSSDFRFHGNNGVSFSNPITSTPTALMDMGAFLLDDKLDINVALRAAESMGEGKVISSPRIVTLDNGQATIEQGVSIPFQTFEGGDAKLEFIDAVLSLKVVPHITSDRSIIMDIEVTRNAPDESVPTPTGSPAIAKAEASTTTLVKDGQTLVLGGIYTIDKSERESRVPYLHRLPVIGAAFRSKELTDLRKELLIFVTPRIVKSPSLATRN